MRYTLYIDSSVKGGEKHETSLHTITYDQPYKCAIKSSSLLYRWGPISPATITLLDATTKRFSGVLQQTTERDTSVF